MFSYVKISVFLFQNKCFLIPKISVILFKISVFIFQNKCLLFQNKCFLIPKEVFSFVKINVFLLASDGGLREKRRL